MNHNKILLKELYLSSCIVYMWLLCNIREMSPSRRFHSLRLPAPRISYTHTYTHILANWKIQSNFSQPECIIRSLLFPLLPISISVLFESIQFFPSRITLLHFIFKLNRIEQSDKENYKAHKKISMWNFLYQ